MMTIITAVLSLALALMVPLSAPATPQEIIPDMTGTPARTVSLELTDFSLCELDLRTLEQKSECFPARVPGDVFTALMEAGRIPDPYRDLNSQAVQWVDRRAWRYETEFNYPPRSDQRGHLLFMGLDYFSRIELNGRVLVMRHEGMFSRVDLDITDYLDPSGRQRLAVILFGVPNHALEKIGPAVSGNEVGRRNYLKTQMSFGWDIALRLKGAGIWDRVYLYETGPVAISDIFIIPHIDGRIQAQIELRGRVDTDSGIELTIAGENFSTSPVKAYAKLKEGESRGLVSLDLQIPEPRLWWPWDMGRPDLYRATVCVLEKDKISDQAAETFGIREISWGQNPDAPPGSADWVLFINGKREFIRGANWVPPEAMLGRLKDEKYIRLLDLAQGCGINLLRVWGGGNRERRTFYDYCDRTGIMVWQEFPFACVFLVGYPRNGHFQEVARSEVSEIVRQLRNHPGLVMWCGGNEFNVKQNRFLVDILTEVTSSLDPTRRFIPASPYKGDSHNWVVWHQMGNLQDYFDDTSPLPSEFGLQSFPDRETLAKWLSPENLWPIAAAYVHHDINWKKMQKYMAALKPADDLSSYIEASQTMQAHYYQRGIENWRQRKYKTSGTIFWMFDESWPAVVGSVVNYELKPKQAYEVLKDTYNPVLVTAQFEDRAWAAGERFDAQVMVVNDLHRRFDDARVEATLCGDAETLTVSIPEDGVILAGSIRKKIPAGCDKPCLDLSLFVDGEKISKNHYDLWIYDPKPAGKTKRDLEKINKMILSGAKQNQRMRP